MPAPVVYPPEVTEIVDSLPPVGQDISYSEFQNAQIVANRGSAFRQYFHELRRQGRIVAVYDRDTGTLRLSRSAG